MLDSIAFVFWGADRLPYWSQDFYTVLKEYRDRLWSNRWMLFKKKHCMVQKLPWVSCHEAYCCVDNNKVWQIGSRVCCGLTLKSRSYLYVVGYVYVWIPVPMHPSGTVTPANHLVEFMNSCYIVLTLEGSTITAYSNIYCTLSPWFLQCEWDPGQPVSWAYNIQTACIVIIH